MSTAETPQGARLPGGAARSAEKPVQLDIEILGRNYKVACKDHERADLLEAVTFLDRRMREIREGGKVNGADRIAVMAALNIANELLRERRVPPALTPVASSSDGSVDGEDARRRIRSMHSAIDQLMAGQEKLF
jgi:cell division protein ZapA